MKPLFPRNINTAGRLVRGMVAVGLFVGAAFAVHTSFWLSLILALFGGFVAFEALRGWCALRACGIKTRL